MSTPRLTIVLEADRRVVSVHARDVKILVEHSEEIVASDMDDTDRNRWDVVKEFLEAAAGAGEPVHGTLHPAPEELDGVWDVVLALTDGSPVFATVLVTPSRLDRMLDEAPAVVEGFALQVLETEAPTAVVLHAAMQGWSRRNFGIVPQFVIEPWREEIRPGSAPDDPVLIESGPLTRFSWGDSPGEVMPVKVLPELVAA